MERQQIEAIIGKYAPVGALSLGQIMFLRNYGEIRPLLPQFDSYMWLDYGCRTFQDLTESVPGLPIEYREENRRSFRCLIAFLSRDDYAVLFPHFLRAVSITPAGDWSTEGWLCTQRMTYLHRMICAGASDGFTIPLLNITQELDSTDISGHGLIQACLSSGNPPLLRRLIQRGVNLYQVNTQGQTYLHVAAKLGANWSVKILIDFAPELSNMRDYQGNTALMLAAAHGEWRTLVTLLPLTNRKLLTDNSGTSILHETVYGGTKSVLQKVLAYCSANDICAMDSTGRTSLEIADVFKKGEFKRMILLRLEELRLEDGLM